MKAALDRYFDLAQRGTSVRTELAAGATTFLTMAYIAFVNPQILSDAGMPFEAVFVATCIAAALSTLLMGLYANYPIALAPGMGLNAFFAYGVVLGMGHTWQVALAAVFISGLLFVILSVLPVRRWIIEAIPKGQKLAIAAGIGLFLGIIALRNAGIIQDSPATLVTVGDLTAAGPILALLGFCVIAALASRQVPGAAIIGMLGVSLVGIVFGVSEWRGIASLPPDPTPTLFALDLAGTMQAGMIAVIVTFLIVDMFDTAGTMIGVAHQARLLDDKRAASRHPEGAGRGLRGNGGRRPGRHLPGYQLHRERRGSQRRRADGADGCRRRRPLPRLPVPRATGGVHSSVRDGSGHSVRGVPHGATPGRRGLAGRDRVRRAVVTVICIPLTFSIADGIGLGFLTYVVIKVIAGRWAECSPTLIAVALLFAVKFAWL